MVSCPACAARFASLPEIERQWFERHTLRAHESRIQHVERDTPKAA